MAGFSGSFPHDLLDLNDWRWQGPVKENGALGDEGDRKAVSVPSDEADTSKIEQYRDEPWFVLVTDGDVGPYVRLRSPAKGSTTSSGSSATTRSELREMHHPDGDRKSAWDAGGSTVHNLKVRLAVTKVMEKNGKRSRVAVAQVHKTTEDGILVYLDGESGKLRWKQDSEVQAGSLGDYTLGAVREHRPVGARRQVHHLRRRRGEGRGQAHRVVGEDLLLQDRLLQPGQQPRRRLPGRRVQRGAHRGGHGAARRCVGARRLRPDRAGRGCDPGRRTEGAAGATDRSDRQQAPRPDPVQRPEAGVEAQPGHQRRR